jgi:hypothetical protein
MKHIRALDRTLEYIYKALIPIRAGINKDNGKCPYLRHTAGIGRFLKIYCSFMESAWNNSLALALRSM